MKKHEIVEVDEDQNDNEVTIEPVPKQKLDDKIKALNSRRVFKKVTPKGDLTWYVKWIASAFILIAVAARSAGGIPEIDLWFSFMGTLGWLAVGAMWHDRAITMLNSALATFLLMGLFNFYYGA